MIVNQNILALRAFLNLQKKIMKNSTPSKLPQLLTTEFFSKIPNRKKISNEHFNLRKAEISLDVS